MTEAMRALLLPLWPALAAALAVGLPFGWLGWREEACGFFGRLCLILAVVALAAGSALVVLGRVPGRPGFWLEISLAVLVAYVAGCLVGSLARAAWLRARPAVSPAA